MDKIDQKYSDYIVYVDESGDHSLGQINEEYPVFVLALCIFKKTYYSQIAAPGLRDLKFGMFGHDMVVLHEHDIRRKKGAFSLFGKEKREVFFDQLNALIAEMDFSIISQTIDKKSIKKQSPKDVHIYHLTMKMCLEELYSFVCEREQDEHLTHVICEARGRSEDEALELEFRRICDGDNIHQKRLPFEIIIADKKSNSEGLQLADLIARPVGLSVLHPTQMNRAFKILERKLRKSPGMVKTNELQKAKDPRVVPEAQAPVE